MKKYMKQCRGYVYEHFKGSMGKEDVVQEMLFLIWQSYCNGNGLSQIIQEQKPIPRWQLHLLFLNALRNLCLLKETETETFHHPEPARVVTNEDGEIIDFYYPRPPDPLEEAEDTKESKVPCGRERERWLERIRRLKEKGYTDLEIVEMLKPSRQEVLF